ncbi:ATP-grasp domain-containing protein [Salininema proteolyticum]|uniref:ATP-grasp domain-containing protein n=1 Tax=Salininema proteolyticum TaxID=1607685 RepID=A0ABV8TU77_9ACTN
MHILMIECNPNGMAGIANALDLGHDVTLVSVDPDFYLAASPLARGNYDHERCTVIKSEDAFDRDKLVALAREIHAERPVDGVTTYSEYHTVHTAAVAADLGLPGMDVEAALNARHKHRTRLTLEGTDIRQPRFAHVADPSGVADAVAEIGFPCVAKPSDGTASLHVQHLKDQDDLDAYLAELDRVEDYGRGVARIPDIVIEEFVEGELISVETCVLAGGEIVNLGLTDRPLSGFPHFIEMGATYFNDHPLREELFETTTKVLRHLGVDFGFLHTEYLLSEDGPVLCEVNGRLIGGIVPSLMEITSGADAYLEVIRQALGEKPELPFPGETIAGGHWFGAPVAGTVRGIDFTDVEGLPGYHSALAYKKPGTVVSRLSKSNFDWIGHVIFTGESREEVNKRCDSALDHIGLDMSIEVAR